MPKKSSTKQRTPRPPRPEILDRLPTDPTPREIRHYCEQIQKTWTASELRKRLGRTQKLPKPDSLIGLSVNE
jgi:hypothetical protein